MDLLELVDLLELDNLDIITYTSPLKVVASGKILRFSRETRVIDFGCGRGEALILWSRYFGVSGLGIDREAIFCDQARQRLKDSGLSDRLDVICADAATYSFERGAYDVASCLNASDIWGGFRPTVQHMKLAIKHGGVLIVAEPYFVTRDIPNELRQLEGDRHTEREILDIIHEEGFELLFVKRASAEECDNYRASFRGALQEAAATYMGSQYYGSAVFAMKQTQG